MALVVRLTQAGGQGVDRADGLVLPGATACIPLTAAMRVNTKQMGQGPLATWVEAETAGVMARHLLMGFELQLYEPVDYAMLYW